MVSLKAEKALFELFSWVNPAASFTEYLMAWCSQAGVLRRVQKQTHVICVSTGDFVIIHIVETGNFEPSHKHRSEEAIRGCLLFICNPKVSMMGWTLLKKVSNK